MAVLHDARLGSEPQNDDTAMSNGDSSTGVANIEASPDKN